MHNNEAYHSNRTHLSSSNLKMILDDIEEFHNRWNLGIYPPEAPKSYLQEGSYMHTLLLEPDKVQQEYAFFEGLRKAGAAWDQFKSMNEGKEILSMPQKLRAESFAKAVQALPAAASLLNGIMETPITATLAGCDVKAKPDCINVEKSYIVDPKTTSDPAGFDIFKETVKKYRYDLSAALYCDVAEKVYGKPFEFYWIVVSKSDVVADVYKASKQTLAEGRALYYTAIKKYQASKASGNWTDSERVPEVLANYEILEI